jgi:hypothetical protein
MLAADPPGRLFIEGPDGKQLRELGLDPEFASWCAKQSLDVGRCFQSTASYGMGLKLLITIGDVRAIPVLREGLSASSAAIVSTAVSGLARLNDAASIPLIAKACSRFGATQAEMIGASAGEYADPAVGLIFEKCIANTDIRGRVATERNERIRARQQTASPGAPVSTP